MPQRKGQFIVNHIRFKLKIPEDRIWHYLFDMRDEDFAELEKEYSIYVAGEIHKPDRQARQEDIAMISNNMKRIIEAGMMNMDETKGEN